MFYLTERAILLPGAEMELELSLLLVAAVVLIASILAFQHWRARKP